MDFKEQFIKFFRAIKSFWQSGKIQRTSRVTYDIVWNITLFFIVIGAVGLFFAGGVGAGYFASLVKDEPIRSYEIMERDIYDYEETSKLYFANHIYLGDIRSDLHREEIRLDQVSETLINAVIATEDEYFNEHKGVVPKAVIRAIVQEATNASMKSGGSTLTQQLIKNQILTNEVSFERKAKEILLALRLEQFFEKDEILEAYLNIIPYGRNAAGRNIAGIQTAAQGIFGINANEVNLPQAAFLAGLPQSPSAYTPYQSSGGLKSREGLQPGIDRMKTVLSRMLDAGYITEQEYERAIRYNIAADFVESAQSPIDHYPALTFELQERAKDILMVKLAEEAGYTREDLKQSSDLYSQYRMLADRDLRRNGYNIYSTIDKEIYDAQQEVVKNYEYFGPDRTTKDGKIEPIQTGGMLIENQTGRIISFVGGREFSLENQLNYATNAVRPNGSTMKPLLDYAPAMEKGVIQPGSAIADIPIKFQYPGMPEPWGPKNYGGGNYGIVSARTALAHSYNIPAAKIYAQIIHDNPVKEYLEKMGFSTLDEVDYSTYSISLGAMTRGVTVEENTNAFATFANSGLFTDAYMIEKITKQDGTVVYEHRPEPVEVFSPQTAYLTIDMMRDVIQYGTAGYLRSQLNHKYVDWAGKTGTTDDYEDAWFIATNPNVTFGTWIGYDTPYNIRDTCRGCTLSYSQRNLKLWAELVNVAAEINPELVAPEHKFERPEGIVSRSYCAISGMAPSELCSKAGLVRSDLFNAKFVPTEVDDSLISGSYVMVNGKAVVAGPHTPQEFVKGDGIMFNPEFLERHGYDKLSDLSQLFPRTNRDLWSRISMPSGKFGGTVEDDGQNPAPPSGLASTGSTLSWQQSGSHDVVGYRIYRANQPGENYSLIGSTTDTSYTIGQQGAVYIVKAVDYFGLESAASEPLTVGNTKPEGEQTDHDINEDDDTVEVESPVNNTPSDPDQGANDESEQSENDQSN